MRNRHFDKTVLGEKQSAVMRISLTSDVNVLGFAQRYREHIVQIDKGIVLDFDKIKDLLHKPMLVLK